MTGKEENETEKRRYTDRMTYTTINTKHKHQKERDRQGKERSTPTLKEEARRQGGKNNNQRMKGRELKQKLIEQTITRSYKGKGRTDDDMQRRETTMTHMERTTKRNEPDRTQTRGGTRKERQGWYMEHNTEKRRRTWKAGEKRR